MLLRLRFLLSLRSLDAGARRLGASSVGGRDIRRDEFGRRLSEDLEQRRFGR
ncbi:MAG: hypothetical protein RML56_01490 [Burkholderiales bacterium]|nr:hypothetical protein [Burkholderiales bacterium]